MFVHNLHKGKQERERETRRKPEMKTPPKHTIFILTLSFFFFSYVHPQTQDSCNSPLSLPTTLPFDTSSLQCVTVWGSENYVLRYVQAAPNTWNFLLSAPNSNAYIGMGFSQDGNMVGSTAIVGWLGSDGIATMQKYFLGGQQPNLVRTIPNDQGLQIGNTTMAAPAQSNRIYMAFQVVSSGQPTNRLIYSVGPTGVLPGGTNFQLTEHRDKISTILNYATGSFETESSPQASLKRSHGILNMIGWAILMPIGAMVARYMKKWDPLWFYSHGIIQTIGFLLGVIGVICGLVLENRLSISVTKHKALGIFILILGCLQVLAWLARPGRGSKFRQYWNWYHHSVGRILVLLAAVNVFYGIHLGKPGSSWNAGFAAVLVILFVVSLILELRIRLRK